MSGRMRGQLNPGEVGKAGEAAVLAYLERTGRQPLDVRDNPDYQRRDIDYLLVDGSSVEVKTDTWLNRTGNLFFEVLRDHGFAGCFTRSKADYWYYVDAATGDCHIFRLSEAQAWLLANPRPEWLTTTRSHRKGGFVEFRGFKVPLDDFKAGVRVTTVRLSL